MATRLERIRSSEVVIARRETGRVRRPPSMSCPATAAEYAYFLFPVAGAHAYNSGRLLDPNALGVRALDAQTLEVRLEAPLVYFPSLTTFMVTFPLRADLLGSYGEAWTEAGNLVSLGPFLLEEWRHEYRVVLRANEDFYRGRPPLDRIVGYMVGEDSTARPVSYSHKREPV